MIRTLRNLTRRRHLFASTTATTQPFLQSHTLLVTTAPGQAFACTHNTTKLAANATPTWMAAAVVAAAAAAVVGWDDSISTVANDASHDDDDDDDTVLTNWSGTHSCRPGSSYYPESVEEVQRLLREHHQEGMKIRVMGTGLSPNAIALPDQGCAFLSLSALDKIISVDTSKNTVTVQAGIKVGDLCEQLGASHGFTLENLASIAEQQVGGFVSVGAHGSGAAIPPVDMQVVSLKLSTPACGTLTLSEADADPTLFHLAKVGLGALGVVVEVTLRCVPSHSLLEHTMARSRAWVRANHAELLRNHRHVRFMWVPHHDTVVVVTNDLLSPAQLLEHNKNNEKRGHEKGSGGAGEDKNAVDAVKPLRELLVAARVERAAAAAGTQTRQPQPQPQGAGKAEAGATAANAKLAYLDEAQKKAALPTTTSTPSLKRVATIRRMKTRNKKKEDPPKQEREKEGSDSDALLRRRLEAEASGLSFSQLRDALLALDPLNTNWVVQVNGAEAKAWKLSEGFRVGRNVDLLQFDCGGQQWVSEVCLPAGTLDNPSGADLDFMEEVLKLIEDRRIPAPSPIEQRWSSNSQSAMSPACATNGQRTRLQAGLNLADTVHSWVGIIMYLPTDNLEDRLRITEKFDEYKSACALQLWPRFDAQEHWAKIEVPGRATQEASAAAATAAATAAAATDDDPAPLSSPGELSAGTVGAGASKGADAGGPPDKGTQKLLELRHVRERLQERYPVASFAAARRALDPKGILCNSHVTALLPLE